MFPSSLTFPYSKTTTLLQDSTVVNLWAITMVVLPSMTYTKAFCTLS
jgi:hypothetical protein